MNREQVIAKWIKKDYADDLDTIAGVQEQLAFSLSSLEGDKKDAARYELFCLSLHYIEVYTENCLRNEALANTTIYAMTPKV